MRKPRCVAVAATLSSRGEDELTAKMQSHIDGCFVCRSELSEYRAWQTQLELVRATQYQAPREVYPRVMADIGPWAVPDPDPAKAGKVKVAAAAAVATAATAAAGTAVLFRLYRQRAA